MQYLTNDAWSAVTEGRVGGAGGNTTLIPCEMGKLPPAGLCPGFWPRVPPALTHVSLDSCERGTQALCDPVLLLIALVAAADTGDCFWVARAHPHVWPPLSTEVRML